MNEKYEQAVGLGFKAAFTHPEAHRVHVLMDRPGLFTTPGSPYYMPALIPQNKDWPERIRELVLTSTLALVADIWTQLLTTKRDYKEKEIYLLWDDEIPKPNPLTALIWLLTCESWPMLTHQDINQMEINPNDWDDLERLFPPQSFLLPQSTPYGYASTRPHGFSEGMTPPLMQAKSLTGLLVSSMHRGDREKMESVADRPVLHRPQVKNPTSYVLHEKHTAPHATWRQWEGWPRTSMKMLDHNMAAHEYMESVHHIAALQNLRAGLMKNVLTIPGIPTHRDNLHTYAGKWIRNWSEVGLMTITRPGTELRWTTDDSSVTLNSGAKLAHIPPHAPRVWFGWTHVGPKYEQEAFGEVNKRVITASEEWARAYMAYRKHALRMLFFPDSIDVGTLLLRAGTARGNALDRAGRIGKPGSTQKLSQLAGLTELIKNNVDKMPKE